MRQIYIALICVAIVIGGFTFEKYLKDIGVHDTYGEYIAKLHLKMDKWTCDELLDWAYEDGGVYAPPPPERPYAKDLARMKCPADQSWLNPEIPVKEKIPTMDELYEDWKK